MKPQDFLVGIRDFFALVVPGAIFLVCMPVHPPGHLVPPDPTLKLFAAAIAAYLVGAIASAVGSRLDRPVDTSLESRWLASRWRLDERGRLAGMLRDRLLGPLTKAERAEYDESVKTFWWSHLRLRCPEAIGELDRIEAMQKLCRSLVPIFTFLAIWYAWRCDPGPATASSAAALVSLIFYVFGRAVFLTTVYRYGAAYFIARQDRDD
jgi:hypothetical protein